MTEKTKAENVHRKIEKKRANTTMHKKNHIYQRRKVLANMKREYGQ